MIYLSALRKKLYILLFKMKLVLTAEFIIQVLTKYMGEGGGVFVVLEQSLVSYLLLLPGRDLATLS